jgi:DNA-binding beta-propeller fold protein YncE
MLTHTKGDRAMSIRIRQSLIAVIAPCALITLLPLSLAAGPNDTQSVRFRAPAGNLPTTREIFIDGLRAAILPNGRFITPAGVEVNVQAPKPFGLALSPDDETLATINSGSTPFSVTLIRNANSAIPTVQRVDVNATFMGVAFSSDGQRFYASGGDNGNIWIGNTATGAIIGSVNLNGQTHPLDRPLNPNTTPAMRFKGAFPGNMALSGNGRYLYVVDQAGFQVHVIDTSQIVTGLDGSGLIIEPDNFQAVKAKRKVGRYPFAATLSPDDKTLYVTHVGVFEYTHLGPAQGEGSGDSNEDFPLCYPGAGYPEETADSRTIMIKKVDPTNLPLTLRDPDGIRCGYIAGDRTFTVPGLGNPNAPESSSVYILDVSNPLQPSVNTIIKTGLLIGEDDRGIKAYSGSHPNAVVVGPKAIYVANGNNDTISVLHLKTLKELHRIELSILRGSDSRLKGIQPVGLALSPNGDLLYVAEAGINAIGVVDLHGRSGGDVIGHIPTGWWPSSVRVSTEGETLYVANARGRGAGPNNPVPPDNLGSPKSSVLGTANIIPVPSAAKLADYTHRVLANNGFVPSDPPTDDDNPIPSTPGKPSAQIKHVIFINKENAAYDLLLGNITSTRKGVPVNGDPNLWLGAPGGPNPDPNHIELALSFGFSDNFYLEPSVSSDGHRWLTNTYTSEFEETHWPASYGGKRRDSGDDKAVFIPYPGRLGFTDANSSPEPNDYNVHGGIYMHLARNGKSFVNFGNGYEFAIVDEDGGTEPTGIRNHVNVPMEKILRDNSDHLYPEFNTHIPDAPLDEDPTRFNRFDRFKQVFEAHYVDLGAGTCKLPAYVDLYYPNDHGGGPFDINPAPGPAWSYSRFVQDNDAALGKTVELISHSPCWKDTVIFVVEDDTQNGFDHVDGHRSIFLAVSPWVKREYLSKTHTSLASIFKTVNLILGLPPLNQYDAAATDLRDMFTATPNYTPYVFEPIQFALGANATWLAMTKDIDFSRPDRDELRLRAAIMKSEGLPRVAAAEREGNAR